MQAANEAKRNARAGAPLGSAGVYNDPESKRTKKIGLRFENRIYLKLFNSFNFNRNCFAFRIVECVGAPGTRPGPRISGLAALHLRLAYGSPLSRLRVKFKD